MKQEPDQLPAEPTKKVYTAILAVMAGLAHKGISKDRKNAQQNYNFRGIDDIYNELAGLLVSAGLLMLPRVLSRECQERATKTGGVLFYTVVHVEFDFVCVDDNSRHTVSIFGEAMDSADKSTNKAMSAAYKYCALQAFCIPTEGDNDADASTLLVVPNTAKPTAPQQRQEAQQEIVLPPYSEESFKKNSSIWQQAIAAGRKTHQQVIELLEKNFTLTNDQINAIKKL